MAYTAVWIQMFFVFTVVFAAASDTEYRVRLSVLCWTKFGFWQPSARFGFDGRGTQTDLF
jgi:hypothetical protein